MANPNFTAPTFSQPIADDKGFCTRAWFLALVSLFTPSAESSVTPGVSPFTFTAPQAGTLLVVGGTGVSIQLRRTQTVSTGVAAGFVPVSSGDDVIITYVVAPTLTFYPR